MARYRYRYVSARPVDSRFARRRSVSTLNNVQLWRLLKRWKLFLLSTLGSDINERSRIQNWQTVCLVQVLGRQDFWLYGSGSSCINRHQTMRVPKRLYGHADHLRNAVPAGSPPDTEMALRSLCNRFEAAEQ